MGWARPLGSVVRKGGPSLEMADRLCRVRVGHFDGGSIDWAQLQFQGEPGHPVGGNRGSVQVVPSRISRPLLARSRGGVEFGRLRGARRRRHRTSFGHVRGGRRARSGGRRGCRQSPDGTRPARSDPIRPGTCVVPSCLPRCRFLPLPDRRDGRSRGRDNAGPHGAADKRRLHRPHQRAVPAVTDSGIASPVDSSQRCPELRR